MPDAFKNAGLYVGLFGTMILGAICTHCMHMVSKNSFVLVNSGDLIYIPIVVGEMFT